MRNQPTILVESGGIIWFKIGKEMCSGSILSLIYICGKNENGIKTVERNINNFRHADDITFRSEARKI